jgi:hypothetical protein
MAKATVEDPFLLTRGDTIASIHSKDDNMPGCAIPRPVGF